MIDVMHIIAVLARAAKRATPALWARRRLRRTIARPRRSGLRRPGCLLLRPRCAGSRVVPTSVGSRGRLHRERRLLTGDALGASERGPDRWAAPVRYLREYPQAGIGPRGLPYYACDLCAQPLQALPRTSAGGAPGVMLVCIWGCGQRFWVDDDG